MANPRQPAGSRRAHRPAIVIGTVLAIALACLAIGYIDTNRPRLREIVVPVPGLSRQITILQASDLHGHEFGARQRLISELLGDRRFDAVLITGDLIDRQGEDRTAAFDLIDRLSGHAPTIYFVMGNHDDPDLPDDLATRGVRTLAAGDEAYVGGGRDVVVVSADWQGAVRATPPGNRRALIVAMHQPPDAATLAAADRFGPGTQLFLAGHTHGGQIRLPLVGAVRSPVRWVFGPILGGSPDEWFPELRGTQVVGVRHDGDRWVAISAGLGTTLARFRFLDRAEMSVVRLVPAENP